VTGASDRSLPPPRMYTDLAPLGRWISAPESYAAEAAVWRSALRARLGPGRHKLLELGSGWGCNLSHLLDEFDAEASDVSPEMIAEFAKRLPDVPVHRGDMRTFRLGRTFDAVLVHDAIMYMRSEDDLRAVFRTASAHLHPAGWLLVAPDHVRETFDGPYLTHGTKSLGDRTLTHVEFAHDPDPSDTTTDSLHAYVIHDAQGTRVVTDHHRLGLFPKATWTRLLAEAGFDVELVDYDVHDDGHDAWIFAGRLRG